MSLSRKLCFLPSGVLRLLHVNASFTEVFFVALLIQHLNHFYFVAPISYEREFVFAGATFSGRNIGLGKIDLYVHSYKRNHAIFSGC